MQVCNATRMNVFFFFLLLLILNFKIESSFSSTWRRLFNVYGLKDVVHDERKHRQARENDQVGDDVAVRVVEQLIFAARRSLCRVCLIFTVVRHFIQLVLLLHFVDAVHLLLDLGH